MRKLIRFMFAPALWSLLVLGPAVVPSQAGLVVSTTPVAANPGDAGFFEILLTNDSAPDRTLAAFSLDLEVGAGVLVTSVDEATTSAPYVFGADGSGQLTFDPLPASAVSISDLDFSLDGFVTIGAGDTVGLARVGYQIAANAPAGPVSISFVKGPVTLILSAAGPAYPDTIVTTNPGTIDVNPGTGTVPEPSTALMVALGGLGLAASVRRRGAR